MHKYFLKLPSIVIFVFVADSVLSFMTMVYFPHKIIVYLANKKDMKMCGCKNCFKTTACFNVNCAYKFHNSFQFKTALLNFLQLSD